MLKERYNNMAKEFNKYKDVIPVNKLKHCYILQQLTNNYQHQQ